MYPVCKRCDKSNKKCHYVYHPKLEVVATSGNEPMAEVFMSGWIFEVGQHTQSNHGHGMSLDFGNVETLQQYKAGSPTLEKSLGQLGELAPVSGSQGWAFLYEQIRGYPLAFAKEGRTIFINHSLYGSSYPPQLRAAFGVCAGCAFLNDRNRPVLFEALDAEVLGLRTSAFTNTLLQDLIILQAAVLYQIIRLFYGDLEQRIVAERQEYLVRSYALKVLQRAEKELQNTLLTWKDWILAESIRRTVFISFKVYTAYSYFRNGLCNEYKALDHLPVTTKPSLWDSPEAFLKHPQHDTTTTYHDFVSSWALAPRFTLEPFEKLVLMAWKGSDQFESMIVQSVTA
jgi:hypothetical protein